MSLACSVGCHWAVNLEKREDSSGWPEVESCMSWKTLAFWRNRMYLIDSMLGVSECPVGDVNRRRRSWVQDL